MKKKNAIIISTIIVAISIGGIISGMYFTGNLLFNSKSGYFIMDHAGRNVNVPNNPERIIGVNPGTLRLLCYLGLADKVVGIESLENTSATRPYNFAYPSLGNLPQIGPMFGGDPELIVSVNPDVIFATYMEASDADTLQQKTNVPVVIIAYGNLGDNKVGFYSSLRLIATIMHVEQRAENLISFIDSIIGDLNNRTKDILDVNKVATYIGGVGYHGMHGLSSTEPAYPPFTLVNAKNVASSLGVEHAFVDDEQVINWDPYILFIDGGGLNLAIQDIQNGSALWSTLSAVQENRTHVVLPYNWYNTNFETVLIDAFYIGKVLYPSNFSDVVLETKASEIYIQFLGTDVYLNMINEYGGCYQLDTSTL
ncbi:MAG: iron ABC transporter substrate-binding protein [Promethearchaeota archaeon]